VYAKVLTLSRDLGIFPKHTPSSPVLYETQSEATAQAFIFLYCSITSLPNIRILLKIGEAPDLQKKIMRAFLCCRLVSATHLDLQIKIPNYLYLRLNNFKVILR